MDFIFSAITWNSDGVLFSIFGFDVRYYSLCWAIGLLSAYLIVKKLYKKQNIDDKLFDPLFLYCFIGILLGARLGHCLFYEPERYLSDPLAIIIPFENGEFTGFQGLASHGGIIGVILALALYIKKTKIPFLKVLDCLGVASPLFAAMVRLGNFMNSEIIGTATDAPWGVIFVNAGLSEPHHPAQLYEAIAYLIVFVIVILLYTKHKDKLGSGLFSGVTLFTIFTFRFFVEYIKVEQVEFEKGMFINMGQILSIPLIITGLYLIYRSINVKKEKA